MWSKFHQQWQQCPTPELVNTITSKVNKQLRRSKILQTKFIQSNTNRNWRILFWWKYILAKTYFCRQKLFLPVQFLPWTKPVFHRLANTCQPWLDRGNTYPRMTYWDGIRDEKFCLSERGCTLQEQIYYKLQFLFNRLLFRTYSLFTATFRSLKIQRKRNKIGAKESAEHGYLCWLSAAPVKHERAGKSSTSSSFTAKHTMQKLQDSVHEIITTDAVV